MNHAKLRKADSQEKLIHSTMECLENADEAAPCFVTQATDLRFYVQQMGAASVQIPTMVTVCPTFPR
jgi:hypothetical protein